MKELILMLLFLSSLAPARNFLTGFIKQESRFSSINSNSWHGVRENKSMFCDMFTGDETREFKVISSDSAVVDHDNKEKNLRHSVGGSLFMLGNFAPGEPPCFFQLSYSYSITPEDILYLEAITWTYREPLGTYGSSERFYPGKIRAYGIGAGYQRIIAGDWFAAVSATPFFQQFFNEENGKIRSGFQLYMQFIAGYRFKFFNERLYVEPAYALKYWPVNTNFPDSFKEIEKGAPNHIFEPSLNFGIRF